MDGRVEGDEWGPVVALCRTLVGELPRLVPGIVDVIRAEVPEYVVVPRREHEMHVAEQYRGLLAGLAHRRLPSAAERERAAVLGRRRAEEGLPAQAMISAFHVGYREMWNALLVQAGGSDAPAAAHLVRLVGIVWTWVQEVSSVSAAAHQDAVRAEDAVELGTTYRFLAALYGPAPRQPEVDRLARAAGFDPFGEFLAVCAPSRAWSEDAMILLRRRFAGPRGTARCAHRGAAMTVMSQGLDAGTLVEAVRGIVPGGPVGVGLSRAGLEGAATTVLDAEEALSLASDSGRTVRFASDWMLAALTTQADRLAPVLGAGRRVGSGHAELAETVRAFARSGFSLTATSRALHLHPNTVKYRLGRWQKLTGWDVHTWQGLSASMVALDLPVAEEGRDPAD